MSTGHAAKDSHRTCIITMVHGTWGRGFFPKEYRASWWHRLLRIGPPWFHEGSVFRRTLESELQKEDIAATFRIFEWSGDNSVFHRARAADKLTSLLASDPDDASSIVIAHSHGGNVAFRAISILGSQGARIHLITLATPFLRVFPTWSGPGFWEVALGGLFMFALGGGVLSPGPSSGHWAAVMAFLLVLYAVMTFLLALFINPSPPSAKRQLDRQTKTWAWRPFNIAEATNYDSAGPDAPNLLVIRGVDDEAALALAFGSIATAIHRFAFGGIWFYLLLFLLFFGYALFFLDDAGFEKAFVLVFFITMFGFLSLLWVPSLFNSRFGREFLIGAARCEVATHSAPDSSRCRIITLETPNPSWQAETMPTLSMRHRIYNYPRCVPEIVKWINEYVR